jgi:two-component system chemotaxis sensor kinase CheA
MASEGIIEEYVVEVKEHLQELEQSLLTMEREGTSQEGIGEIFRAAHSIKGAAAYMGFEHMANLTHGLESIIGQIQTRARPVTQRGITAMLECVDVIAGALGHLQETGDEPPLPPGFLDALQQVFENDGAKTDTRTETDPLHIGHGTAGMPEDAGSLQNAPGARETPDAWDAQDDGEIFKDLFPESDMPGERECNLPFADQRGGDDDGGMIEDLFSLKQGEEKKPAESEEIIEEEDQELFAIFSQSFLENLAELEKLLASAADNPLSDDDFQEALGKLKSLSSSSQYMDYGTVVDLLRRWEDSFFRAQHHDPATGRHHLESLGSLKENLQTVLPGLGLGVRQPPATPAASPKDELIREEDQELFSIFLDAFRQHLIDLVKLAPATPGAGLSKGDLERARELLRKLISSSQYMDYGKVVDLLAEWEESLLEVSKTPPLDGRAYTHLLDTYGQRLQRILPGLDEAFAPEAPGAASFPDGASAGAAPSDPFASQPVYSADSDLDSFIDEEDPALDMDRHDEETLPELHSLERGVAPAAEDGGAGERRQPEKIVAKPVRTAASSVSDEAQPITLRVEAPKVDQLLNQVGELVVIRSEFIQTAHSFRDMLRELASQGRLSKQELKKLRSFGFRLNESTQSLGRVSNDLQDSVMRIRMLPISHLFRRFPRVVRDQALKLGKSVELVLEGGETEIDKRVLEQMHDPIIQFLRNGLVHGIEPPRERARANKPETGIIRLAAYHEGDYVTLEIEDDGRGIDLDKLRRVLQERKELGPHELERLTDEELMYAVFLPGISTHDGVDGTAGRGVGLDVVKENVERMNGTIEVDSYPGSGTRFMIRIPLTVAIIRALLLKGGDQVFTLPLSSVTEILRYRHENAFTIEGFQVISLRGKTIPLVHLSELLNRPTDRMENGHKFIVIVTTSFREVGLVVDGLIGEREVVMKPIEDDFHSFKGFSGATILGDGTISLILDVSSLLRAMRDGPGGPGQGESQSQSQPHSESERTPAPAPEREPRSPRQRSYLH